MLICLFVHLIGTHFMILQIACTKLHNLHGKVLHETICQHSHSQMNEVNVTWLKLLSRSGNNITKVSYHKIGNTVDRVWVNGLVVW